MFERFHVEFQAKKKVGARFTAKSLEEMGWRPYIHELCAVYWFEWQVHHTVC